MLRRLHRTVTDRDRLAPDGSLQPRHFFVHVASLTSTKTADGLVDPKLVLSWLLGQFGASGALIGLLVPIRESLALLPQVAIAGRIARRPRRKGIWAGAALVQGLAAAGMGASALLLEGRAAAIAIVLLLVVLATARSFASVTYKDVLGQTVSRRTRGTATGSAATLSSAFVLGYGALFATGLVPLSIRSVAIGLVVAGALFAGASILFMGLEEEPRDVGDEDGGEGGLSGQLRLLRERTQLRRFIGVRALLVATALSPPFLVALGVESRGGEGAGRALGSLGPYVIASALASLVSGYVWGRLADRSSRRTLQAAGALGALTLGAAAALGAGAPDGIGTWSIAGLLAAISLAHQGVRLGRSTHLVDMAPEGDRAAYTALSNTAIGAVLIAGGALGLVADAAGLPATLGVLAGLCALAAAFGQRLEEVQGGR